MSYLGKLLIAPPALEDEFWGKTVIFIYEQNISSIMGLILNKNTNRPLAELMQHHKLDYVGEDPIYIGGPVNPSALVMLHTTDWVCINSLNVGDEYAVSSDRTMLNRISQLDQPNCWKMFLGMCAWTPNQLEQELAEKKVGWLTAEADLETIFDNDPDRMWNHAVELAAKELAESYFTIN